MHLRRARAVANTIITPDRKNARARAINQLESVGLPNTEDNRRALRELLFTADGVERYISGVVSQSRS